MPYFLLRRQLPITPESDQGEMLRVNTRERIEEQALLLFSRRGYHETSVLEIAEAAEVHEGTKDTKLRNLPQRKSKAA